MSCTQFTLTLFNRSVFFFYKAKPKLVILPTVAVLVASIHELSLVLQTWRKCSLNVPRILNEPNVPQQREKNLNEHYTYIIIIRE